MNKKTIYIIIGFILTVLLSVGITLAIVLPKNENTKPENTKEKENVKESESEEILEEPEKEADSLEDVTNQSEADSKKDDNIVIKDGSTYDKNNEPKLEDNTESYEPIIETALASDAEIVSYAEQVANAEGSTLKDGFVKVIDFLFYGGEISGRTFSELSASAKLKVVAVAIKIDGKIEEYFPEYKENISESTNRVYTNVKSKAIELYLDTTVKICSENEELCIDAKAGLEDLKTSFGITWDFIKDISGVGLTKLKNWYEVWREE